MDVLLMSRSEITKGLWLGLLGIVIFSVTLPMTRLAVGTPDAPQMSGLFIAMGRAVVAAGLSTLLLATRAPWPERHDWLPLVITSAGVVFGFPLFTSIAMRYVEAMHASVIVGVLPLTTAAVGALLHRQRPSLGFWLCAAFGSALVVLFAILRSGVSTVGISFADLLLLAAMGCAAVGYCYGGRLAQHMRAEHVICWALIIALPITLPLSVYAWPTQAIRPAAWWGFGYVAVFSMWLGFFAWYRGLALGGTVRVSQVQLVQPFLSMLFAIALLGEKLDAVTVAFGVAVIATVFLGKKMPVGVPEGTSK
jgi:drug/metabolite transporter (DMT)-like permease